MCDEQILFREVQRFRQPWIAAVVVCGLILVVGVFSYGLVSQLVFDEPFGNKPVSNVCLVIQAVVAISVCLAVLVLLWLSKLLTEVRGDGLYVRFFPFHRRFRKIPLEKVVSFRALTYRPIWEYGGWGLRWRPGGRAYNVRGRRGVRLEFENGKHLLIGSQRAEELEAAIGTLLRSRT